MPNNRDNARRGEIVRLYAQFFANDSLKDPYYIGYVNILNGSYGVVQSGLSPARESIGRYYIDWSVPSGQSIGYHYDRWYDIRFTIASSGIIHTLTFPVLYGSVDEIRIPDEATVPSGLCRVYDFFASPDGEPLEGIKAKASLANLPYYDEGFVYINDREAVTNYTNANGRVSWDITQGAIVHFEIRAASFSKIKRIPFENTARISELEDA